MKEYEEELEVLDGKLRAEKGKNEEFNGKVSEMEQEIRALLEEREREIKEQTVKQQQELK